MLLTHALHGCAAAAGAAGAVPLPHEHPAFKGRVYVDDSGPASLRKVTWDYKGLHKAVLVADVASHAFSISHTP